MFEMWFIWAVLSVLAAGAGAFLYKIAVQKKWDIVLLNFYASCISFLTVGILVSLFADFSGFWHLMLLLSFLTSVTYLMTMVLKVKALEVIDTTIFFPIYKVLSPMISVILGIIFFAESFSPIEWLGIGLSLTVPLLLISSAEGKRQRNLMRGLALTCVAAMISATSGALWKEGADIAPNVWTYLFSAELFSLLMAWAVLRGQKGRNTKTLRENMRVKGYLRTVIVMAVCQTLGGLTIVFAFKAGGTLGIVYTINSLYILIPIVLSIIIYKEHWNLRKVIAIILSIVALGFFG